MFLVFQISNHAAYHQGALQVPQVVHIPQFQYNWTIAFHYCTNDPGYSLLVIFMWLSVWYKVPVETQTVCDICSQWWRVGLSAAALCPVQSGMQPG